jgi:hypothetical protein
MASSYILQDEIDNANRFGELEPVLNVGGSTNQPACTIATICMNTMLAEYPWKWNSVVLPQFYTNSWQQDYAIPGLTTLSWLTDGIVVNINSNSLPKPWAYVEVNRYQGQRTASYLSSPFYSMPLFTANWLPNSSLYYGTWGASNSGNATLGNNPGPHVVITQPLGQNSMPNNPVLQVRDPNGNLQVVTTYGTCGSGTPTWPAASSPAGTTTADGTVTWTVVDPTGQGIRVDPVPSQSGVVWQFNLIGQNQPLKFTTLAQSLDPIPDEFEPHFQALFVAQCYRYSPETKIRAKFPLEWQMAKESLQLARSKSDRERDEVGFVPAQGIMTGGLGSGWMGGAWPYNYPIR